MPMKKHKAGANREPMRQIEVERANGKSTPQACKARALNSASARGYGSGLVAQKNALGLVARDANKNLQLLAVCDEEILAGVILGAGHCDEAGPARRLVAIRHLCFENVDYFAQSLAFR